MRHLKLYEHEENELKKYAIWYSISNDEYEIIEIVDREKLTTSIIQYTSKTIYKFSKTTLVDVYSNEEKFQSLAVKSHIPYTSDNVQDCITEIEILLTANKYNL